MDTWSADEPVPPRVTGGRPVPPCPTCGARGAPTAVWCGHCGARLRDLPRRHDATTSTIVRFAGADGGADRHRDDPAAGLPGGSGRVAVATRGPRRARGPIALVLAVTAVVAGVLLLPDVPGGAGRDAARGPAVEEVVVDLGASGPAATAPLAWAVGAGAVAVRGGPVVDVSSDRPTTAPAAASGAAVADPRPDAAGRLVERPHDQLVLVELDRGVVVATDVRTGRPRWTTDLDSPVRELKVVDGVLGVLVDGEGDGDFVGLLDPARGSVMTLVSGPTLDLDGAAAGRWAIDEAGVAVVTADGVVLTPWRRDASLLPVEAVREVALAGDHVAVHRRDGRGGEVVELWHRRDRSLVARLPVADR